MGQSPIHYSKASDIWKPWNFPFHKIDFNSSRCACTNPSKTVSMFHCCWKHKYSPVSTSAMSISRSSDADASIFPSWLKLIVLTGHSNLMQTRQQEKKKFYILKNSKVAESINKAEASWECLSCLFYG